MKGIEHLDFILDEYCNNKTSASEVARLVSNRMNAYISSTQIRKILVHHGKKPRGATEQLQLDREKYGNEYYLKRKGGFNVGSQFNRI